MKKIKYLGLVLASLAIASCDVNNDLDPIMAPEVVKVALDKGTTDFSNYIAVGASFTAGFTDNALFIAAQENSFPNILSKKFAMADGGEFNQPLMADNIGGLLLQGNIIQGPRLFFDGAAPAVLPADLSNPSSGSALPTTEVTATVTGSMNNYGVPGAKSFHFVAPGYGNVAGVALGAANPYFARFASSANATVIGDAAAKQPTFFTLSEIGGNDVLGYALSGGSGVDQTGNLNPATYGGSDITDPNVFTQAFTGMVTALTAGGAKGVVGTVPYITNLAHFTTVPHNPLDPSTNDALAAQVPLLNQVYGAVSQVYVAAGEPERAIQFSATGANPVIIMDEDATDLTVTIATALSASPTFIPFVESLGLPAAAAPLVAQLLGNQYGKARPATANDLLVLPSSSVIGTVNTTHAAGLVAASNGLLPATLAGQFSAEGITLPLADKWVLTPQEQASIKTATDAYNAVIETTVGNNPNLALVDLKGILQEASSGIMFDDYVMTTSLVTGGLISLDGVHLTARGYALMANKMLEAIDGKFGSNFTKATNGLAKAANYPTNYSPTLR